MLRHIYNSDKKFTRDQYPKKGFSLIELAASLAIFLLAGAIVTLAVGSASVTSSQQRNNQEIINKVNQLVKIASQNSYNSFTDDTWLRPEHCNETTLESCFTILSHDYRVSYTVTPIINNLPLSASLSPSFKIVGSTLLPSGATYSTSYDVIPPNNLLSKSSVGVVKVSVINTTSYQGPLYLYSASTGYNRVISYSSPLNGANMTLLTYPAGTCSPCRISMSPGGDSYIGNYTIDESALSEDGYTIKADKGLTSTTITLRPKASIKLSLWAKNGDGSTYSPPSSTAGSICLYLSFSEGGNIHHLPGCNTLSEPNIISWQYYKASSGSKQYLAAIPTDTDLTLNTDLNNSGLCPDPNTNSPASLTTKAANAYAVFVDGYECTSWTWGWPSKINKKGSGPLETGESFEGSTINISSLTPNIEISALWGASSMAAGINNGDQLWLKARSSRATKSYLAYNTQISSDSSCSQSEYCNSGGDMMPYPTSGLFHTPLGNQWGIVYGAAGVFNLSFIDNDFGTLPYSVTLVQSTQNGNLYSNSNHTTLLTSGSSLISTCSISTCDRNIYYSGSGTDSLVVNVIQNGVSKNYTIGISGDASNIWGVVASTYTQEFLQGESKGYKVSVYNFQGNLAPSVTITTTASTVGYTASNLTASAYTPATSECPELNPGEGCVIARSLSTTSGGTYDIINSSAGGLYSASVANTVVQKPSTLNVLSTTSVNQGGSSSISLKVFDGAGNAISGAAIYLSGITSNLSTWAPSSGSSATSCVSGSDGSCTLLIPFSPGQTAGNYTLSFASGSAVATTTISLGQAVRLVEMSPINISQGAVVSSYIMISDGAGFPMSGITPTIAPISGLEFTISPSDSVGRARLDVTAQGNLSVGVHDTTFSYNSSVKTLRIIVSGKLSSLSGTKSITIPQGFSSTLSLITKDSNGTTIPFAKVSLPQNTGILFPLNATSDYQGKLTIALTAGIDTPLGQLSIPVTINSGETVATLNITVKAGVFGIAPLGAINSGQSGTVTLLLLNVSGNPVADVSVLISSNSVLGITSSTKVSNGSGQINLDYTSNMTSSNKEYNIILTIDGRIFTVPLAVL